MSDDSSKKVEQPKASDTETPVGWGVLGALIYSTLAYLVPQVVLVPLAPILLQLAPYSTNTQTFVLHAAIELLTVVTIAFIVRAYRLRLRDIGLGSFDPMHLAYAVGGFIVYFVLSISINEVVSRFIQVDQNQPQELGYASPVGLELVLIFVALVVLAPLAEELLFRGFLYRGLRRRLSFIPATLVTSLLFAVAHAQLNVGLDVFALSLVLCYMREKTDSLWPGILLHATKNAVAFSLLFVIMTE
ncbi:MAG: lysostaphin resistance A-like protein [Candidatus Saccharimonadales bacterium]